MRTTHVLAALLLTAPLAGAFQIYQEPEDGVELRFENLTTEKQMLASFWAGGEKCSKPQPIGEVERGLSTRLVPDQLTTLSLSARHADIADPESCAVFFTFRPQRGYTYRATLQMFNGRCRLGFNKVELATNAASSVERVLRSYKMPLLPSQGVCAKLDAEQRARLGF